MKNQPQNRNSFIALIVALVAFIATIVVGVIVLLIKSNAFTPKNPGTFTLILEISAGLTILGLAAYAIIEPDRVRNSLSGFFTGRQARYGSNTLVMILAFAGIVLVLNYVFATNSKLKELTNWDLTANKANTLSPELTSALKSLPANMTAIGFFSPQTPKDSAQALFDKMKTASEGKFSYSFMDPVASPVAAKQYGVTGDGKIVLQMNGHNEIANSTDESEILTAMNRLINPEARTVYFLTGHGEHDINSTDQYALTQLKDTLEKKNLTVQTLNLVAVNSVPDDAKAIIIAGPAKPVSDQEVKLLSDFLAKGGALVVMEDPTPITQFGDSPDPLADMLDSQWGLLLRNDFVVDTNNSGNEEAAVGDVFDPSHPITQSMANEITIFPLARSIQLTAKDGFTETSLVQTDPRSLAWGETDFTPLQGTGTSLGYDAGKDAAGPLTLAASSEDTKSNGKVVVIGNSIFASDAGFDKYGNGDLIVNAVSWAAGQGKTYDVTPKDTTQRTYTPPSQVNWLLILFGSVCGIPLIVIGGGVYAWASRRRRG